MVAGLGQLVKALASIVPAPVAIGIGVVLAVALAPRWLQSVRERQLRGLVRRMIRADPPERESLRAEAFALAGTDVERLRVLLLAAVKYTQRPVIDGVIAAFDARGDAIGAREGAWARELVEPRRAKYRDPVEAVLKIERLIASGLLAAAAEQVAIARDVFPEDEEIAALAAKIEQL